MGIAFDDGLSLKVDSTTDPTYVFIFRAQSATALVTDQVWLSKRIVAGAAGGTARFGNGISDFSRADQLMTVAQCLAATYTAG